jgi:hypothetical protein
MKPGDIVYRPDAPAVCYRLTGYQDGWGQLEAIMADATPDSSVEPFSDRLDAYVCVPTVTPEIFERMIERRGYAFCPVLEAPSLTYAITRRAGRYVWRWELRYLSFAAWQPIAEVARKLDDAWFVSGQHHMRCACGYPVLMEQGQPPLYRSTVDGPESPPLARCPLCQARLAESIREIDDETAQ